MSERRAKRRAIKTIQQLKKQLENGNTIWAITGNERGFVEVPESPTQVYVKLEGRADAIVKAYWEIANPMPGLTVVVEERNGKYAAPAARKEQLANASEVEEVDQPPRPFPIGTLPANPSRAEIFRPAQHASSHNWGGSDPVMISLEQILDFRVTPTIPGSLQVYVHGGLLYDHINNRLLQVRPQYYQCVPPEEGIRDFVLYIDKSNNGNLYVTYNDRSKGSPAILEIGSSAELYPIALISLPAGIERIRWRHIIDLRRLYYSGGPAPKAVHPHPLAPSEGVHTVDSLLNPEYVSGYQNAGYQKDESSSLDELATTLVDEIKQLRRIIEEITGEEHWYLIPITSIANLLSYLEASDLGIYGRWDFSEGNIALP